MSIFGAMLVSDTVDAAVISRPGQSDIVSTPSVDNDSPPPPEAETISVPLAHNLDSEKKRTVDIQLTSDGQAVSHTATAAESQLPGPAVRFADLQITSPILRGLTEAGFERPSPVQIKAIPLGRMGLDLIVQAKSGTGKTVVFTVVLLEAIDLQRPVLQALVLAPTREIALQSKTVLERLGVHLPGLKCQLFVGGLPLADDLKHLQSCHIAVGTPGRVRYLIETGYMSTEHIRHLVLDEADLLLAGGAEAKLTGGSANNAFPADINYIWWSLSQTKQVMAFSATYTDYLVEEHLQRYMNNPVIVRLAAHDPALLGVRQFFTVVESPVRSPAAVFAAKIACLCKILSSVDFQQCLIFSNFHSSAQELCDALHSRGWPVSYISSNLDQGERFRAFNRLRAFHCRVLVSTDLTSRGIDAENVNLVVSLEVPWEQEIYLHRVGRAGRFGSYGASILIVADTGDEMNLLRRLQSRCRTKIHKLPDPTPADLAAPDCPVDLDSLVTVVNCTKHDKQRAPPARPTSTGEEQVSKQANDICHAPVDSNQLNGQPSPNRPGATKPSSTITDSRFKRSKESDAWSQLPQDLYTYADQALSKLNAGKNGISDGIAPGSLIELEERLMDTLEAYCDAGMPPISVDNPPVSPSGHTPPITRKFAPPLKEPPKHVLVAPEPSSIDEPERNTSTNCIESVQWTPRQISAWYEYHYLVDYARQYHSAWESAMNEYHAAVNRWNKLRARYTGALSSSD